MQLADSNKPWYSYPLVWMMISIPFSAVIMGVIMIWLAVDTDDGLVVDDYYKQGMEINRIISRDKKAAELGLSAVINFDNKEKIVRLRFEKGSLEAFPATLELKLQHATRADSDISVMLNHGLEDQYIGHLKQALTAGIWYFVIADNDWKLNARSRVSEHNLIELKSDY